MWHLWKNRNLFLFERRFYPTNLIAKKAIEEAGFWKEANTSSDLALKTAAKVERKWEPPSGITKCNVGVACLRRIRWQLFRGSPETTNALF